MKSLIYLFIFIGGAIGGYIPTLWGDTNMLSGWSILGGAIGSFAGLWAALKVKDYL